MQPPGYQTVQDCAENRAQARFRGILRIHFRREKAQLRTTVTQEPAEDRLQLTLEGNERVEKRVPREGRLGIERTTAQVEGSIPPFRILHIRLRAGKL